MTFPKSLGWKSGTARIGHPALNAAHPPFPITVCLKGSENQYDHLYCIVFRPSTVQNLYTRLLGGFYAYFSGISFSQKPVFRLLLVSHENIMRLQTSIETVVGNVIGRGYARGFTCSCQGRLWGPLSVQSLALDCTGFLEVLKLREENPCC